MPTVTITPNFPPQTFQVASGSGTLIGVKANLPAYYLRGGFGNVPAASSQYVPTAPTPKAGYQVDCDLFSGDPRAGGTKLTSINSGDANEQFNLAFSNGLYILARSGSAIDVSYTS